MSSKQNSITAERAREIAREAQSRALDLEVPKMMDKIMAIIERESSYGNMAVRFILGEVYSTDDAAPGLYINDMLDIVFSQLRKQGYDVKIDDMMTVISISWSNSDK